MQSGLNIACNIASLRKHADLTQAELAAYLGVTTAAISKWENGQSFPDIEMLPKLATYFDISIDALVGYEPQMSRDNIRRTCEQLRTAFAEKPFADALNECRVLVRDYYACYPLLVQIAILYLNHLMLAPEANRADFAKEAIELCRRICQNTTASHIKRQAEAIQAQLLLASGKPASAVELLQDSIDVQLGEDILLANAYAATGDAHKADVTLQGSLFSSIVLDLNRLSEMALLHIDDPEKLTAIHKRALALIDIFDFERVFANAIAIHLSFATAFMLSGDANGALACLKDYERACRHLEFPIKLHGGAFFDKADEWIESAIATGSDAPRDQAILIQNILASVTSNPVFTPLENDSRFKRIVKSLEEISR